jgi:hypothetical protein
MHREGSTVLGGIELGKRTRIPAAFLSFGAKVCHPIFGLACRNDEHDRPLTGFEAKIGYLPHTAGAICDVNLRAGLLPRHGTYRKTWQPCVISRSNVGNQRRAAREAAELHGGSRPARWIDGLALSFEDEQPTHKEIFPF